MSKLYKLYLGAMMHELLISDHATLSELIAHSLARRDKDKVLLSCVEFQSELKRLTAVPPTMPKIAPIVLQSCNPQNKIGLIKVLREVALIGGFHSGLKECKDIVDMLFVGVSFTFKVKTAKQREDCIRTLRGAGAIVS